MIRFIWFSGDITGIPVPPAAPNLSGEDTDDTNSVQKFHVLALTRIEENGVDDDADTDDFDHVRHTIGRRPSIKVDNWDFIYTETGTDTMQVSMGI